MTYNRKIPHILKADPQWIKRRAAVLFKEPNCRACAALGYVTPATSVDHIVPRSRGGSLDESNLQPLCKTCHDAKSQQEAKYGRDTRQTVSLDGGRHGRPVSLPEKNYGSSPRSKFLNRSRT